MVGASGSDPGSERYQTWQAFDHTRCVGFSTRRFQHLLGFA